MSATVGRAYSLAMKWKRVKQSADFKVKVRYVPVLDCDQRISRSVDIILESAERRAGRLKDGTDLRRGQPSLRSNVDGPFNSDLKGD